MDYMASGLSYPDDNVQASLCYLWLHLYASAKVSVTLSRQVCKALANILASTSNRLLQLNALGTTIIYTPICVYC